MGEDLSDESENSILYELLEYLVRKQEPGLIRCKNDTVSLPTTGTIKNALRYLNKRNTLPESLVQFVSSSLSWKFAVGDNGTILAILQENIIEFRRLRDEYSSVVAKASVPRDSFPQWRKLAWSPDGTILALSLSNGNISFYNALGNNIFNINSSSISLDLNILEVHDVIVSMIFKECNKKVDKWDYEFLSVTHGGVLNSYYISAANGFKNNHNFSFANFYKNGINGVVHCEKRNLFFVSGNNVYQTCNAPASEAGLTVWRPLNDFPYYKLSSPLEEDIFNKSRFSLWNYIPMMTSKAQTVIFKMSVNPSSELLACLHIDGTVSLWTIPSLKLQVQWKLMEQPDYNIVNPVSEPKFCKYPQGISKFHPTDIGWWSNQAIVIARYSGAISICSIKNLRNLLGSSPEFLFGPVQIVESSATRGVLCLDCEVYVMSTKRNSSDDDLIFESDKETVDSEPTTFFNHATNILQSTLYSMTDIEKFQPKRRKSKIFHRTYRILGLKSTTPEELYSRKIDIEEYEEALNLANIYHLDKDLVYQTQWRKSEFSLKAIEEHLSKVTKRSWVLNECASRVPNDLVAARELLNFGLKQCSLETMLSLDDNYDTDDIDFISLKNEDLIESDEVNVTLYQIQKMNQIIQKINVSRLNNAQKDIIRSRKRLLNHVDMLKTYEILLDDPADYDTTFYQEFRQMSPIENAVRFAKDGNCKGVIVMFTYFESALIPHWLPIISFFPETLNPISYKALLPKCDNEGQLYLLDQEELRQKDWCERIEFQDILITDSDKDEALIILYENNSWFSKYRGTTLTQDILSDWYKRRCYEIERLSGLVDNALSLIYLGKSYNITGLEKLLIDLETLDDLVYKVKLEHQTLDDLDKLSDLEKVKLLMIQANEANFIDHVNNILIPFAKKKQIYVKEEVIKKLIYDYFLSLSKDTLFYILEFIRFIVNARNPEVYDIVDDYVQLALDCLYCCDNKYMWSDAKNISEIIVEDYENAEMKTSVTREALEVVEKELDCLEIFNKYNVNIPLNFVKDNKNNAEYVRALFVQVCETVKKEVPPANEKTWSQLLSDLLDMQELVFESIDTDSCLEIYLQTRLKSGIKSIIQNSKSLMITSKTNSVLFKVPFDKSVDLVLEASYEYFNNATSLVDPNMDLAKTCLHLIESDHKKIKEEFDLINSLQLLYDFHLNILPLQVKLTQDKLKIIEDCLNSRSDSYYMKDKLLTVAKHLRIDNNARNREGKVLDLIARKAFQAEDYKYCSKIIRRLIEINHVSSWQIASQLGRCDKFTDLKFRRECSWFVMNIGPDDLLQETIKYINNLETELLNIDLQNWVEVKQSSLESEDEFSDAISSPSVERKEFFPNIIGSSSSLVKASTKIVTQSMIDIVKNRDIWTGNFANFLKKNESSTDKGNIDSDRSGRVQSFPCFYESLHPENKISNLDANYNSFSIKDNRSDEFKLCQTLLRVQALKESSCYGEEINDINQLLIECAKNTITEDCLLAIGYLLSVKTDRISEIKNVFDNLPQTEFLNQLAAYYCSLQLYKKLNLDFEKAFSYDPIDLVILVANSIENSDSEDEVATLLKEKLRVLRNIKEEKKTVIDNGQTKKSNEVEEINNSDGAADGWDDQWDDAGWGDFDVEEPKEINKVDSNDEILLICESNEPVLEKPVRPDMTENERFDFFEEKFSKIEDKESFDELKHLLQSWPLFFDEQYLTADKNPILKMVLKVKQFSNKNNANEEEVLEEYKDLLKDQIIPREALIEFLEQNGGKFSPEEKMFLKLRSDESFHTEIVDMIKERKEDLKLPSIIIEEVFFQNLTPHFSPNHHMYHKILEVVFMNRTTPEIQENIEILIKKLMLQKNVPHAVALLSHLESVPPSLSTYDSCFHRLLKDENYNRN